MCLYIYCFLFVRRQYIVYVFLYFGYLCFAPAYERGSLFYPFCKQVYVGYVFYLFGKGLQLFYSLVVVKFIGLCHFCVDVIIKLTNMLSNPVEVGAKPLQNYLIF